MTNDLTASNEKQREVLGEIEKICNDFIAKGVTRETYNSSKACDRMLRMRAIFGSVYLSLPLDTAQKYEGLIRIADSINRDYMERRHYERLMERMGMKPDADITG